MYHAAFTTRVVFFFFVLLKVEKNVPEVHLGLRAVLY